MSFDPSYLESQKSIEGQRLGPLFGAVGALPAAALVLGKDVAPGAPLFLAAAFLSCAAYAFWQLTDNAYFLDHVAWHEKDDRQPGIERFAYHLQHSTFFYAAISLLVTGFGFAAVYSTWRIDISVERGFILASLMLIVGGAHYFLCMRKINGLIRDSNGQSFS